MNTPNNKPILRIGLSRTSGSIKKRYSALATPTSSASDKSSTPASSSSDSPKTSEVNKVIIKKKLEFAAKKHLEISDDEKDPDLESLDLDSLKAHVEKMQKKLEVLEKHQKEKKELIELTEKWKQAGLEAMDILRDWKEATYEEVLDSFKIPHEYFL